LEKFVLAVREDHRSLPQLALLILLLELFNGQFLRVVFIDSKG